MSYKDTLYLKLHYRGELKQQFWGSDLENKTKTRNSRWLIGEILLSSISPSLFAGLISLFSYSFFSPLLTYVTLPYLSKHSSPSFFCLGTTSIDFSISVYKELSSYLIIYGVSLSLQSYNIYNYHHIYMRDLNRLMETCLKIKCLYFRAYVLFQYLKKFFSSFFIDLFSSPFPPLSCPSSFPASPPWHQQITFHPTPSPFWTALSRTSCILREVKWPLLLRRQRLLKVSASVFFTVSQGQNLMLTSCIISICFLK